MLCETACITSRKEVGENCHIFMEKLLTGNFPWSKLRQAQKLIRLSEKYGNARIDQACHRAVSFELIDVYRVERIVVQAITNDIGTENKGVVLTGRFQRCGDYFVHTKEGVRNGT